MLLHEAVTKARKDLGLSQKRLSELAGIQRRQLATLESGGNVTLATLRKVLAHLPNLETFTLDTVTATVKRESSQKEKVRAFRSAMQILEKALHSMVDAVAEGRPPVEASQGFREMSALLDREFEPTAEEKEAGRRRAAEETAALGTVTEETITMLAKRGFAHLEELKRRVPPVEDEPAAEADVADDDEASDDE